MATITSTPRVFDDAVRFGSVKLWVTEDQDENGDLLPVNDRIMCQVEWRVDLEPSGEVLGESYTGLLKDFPDMTAQEKLDAKASAIALYNAGKAQSAHS